MNTEYRDDSMRRYIEDGCVITNLATPDSITERITKLQNDKTQMEQKKEQLEKELSALEHQLHTVSNRLSCLQHLFDTYENRNMDFVLLDDDTILPKIMFTTVAKGRAEEIERERWSEERKKKRAELEEQRKNDPNYRKSQRPTRRRRVCSDGFMKTLQVVKPLEDPSNDSDLINSSSEILPSGMSPRSAEV